jgi:hypothetical protein
MTLNAHDITESVKFDSVGLWTIICIEMNGITEGSESLV